MKRTFIILGTVFVMLFGSWWFFLRGDASGSGDIIYRTEKVARGDVTRSFNASGVLQPLTVVDVKSKAGGAVVELKVDEGSVVKQGQLVARIDPRDTRALYEQAVADLSSNQARKTQNALELQMQAVQSRESVKSAEASLSSAKLRLQTLEAQSGAQPQLTAAAIAQAQSNYDVAKNNLETLQRVTIPQTRAQLNGDYNRAKADLDASKANYERYTSLLQKGYVSQAATDQARTAYEAAVAAFDNARVRREKMEDDFKIQVAAADARLKQAQAALQQERANSIAIGNKVRELLDAREAVKQAEAALAQAKANLKQVDVRRAELQAANAAIVRSRVSRDNAKVQLESTTVLAPREGVVIKKYLEEGTIIPPGTSVFSEGTSIVQIADTSKMYVEVMVDEADIAKVKLGQMVRVRLESAPRTPIAGTVSRINPGAVTNNNVTQVKVRVEVAGNQKVKLMPGLNASCEFVETEKKDVFFVPAQAVQHEGEKTFVEIMASPNKPVKREVTVGITGNANIEVLSGLKEGEEVVTSKIDKKQIEEQQQRMDDAAQQRNPFSGGSRTTGGRTR